jgi:hypothetical protein
MILLTNRGHVYKLWSYVLLPIRAVNEWPQTIWRQGNVALGL